MEKLFLNLNNQYPAILITGHRQAGKTTMLKKLMENVFYSSFTGTYLERDVKSLSGTIDSLKFFNFITAVAARTAQMVNYKSISDDCDIDQVTAKNWLHIIKFKI